MDQNEIETNNFDVPPNITIDTLRNEVARINDERISLATKLNFASQIIESLKYQLNEANNGNNIDVSQEHDETE